MGGTAVSDKQYIKLLEDQLGKLRWAVLEDIDLYKECVDGDPNDIFFNSIQALAQCKDNRQNGEEE